MEMITQIHSPYDIYKLASSPRKVFSLRLCDCFELRKGSTLEAEISENTTFFLYQVPRGIQLDNLRLESVLHNWIYREEETNSAFIQNYESVIVNHSFQAMSH